MVVESAGYVCGTRGLTADVLWMSVVCGMIILDHI